jgi:hypothetical protein
MHHTTLELIVDHIENVLNKPIIDMKSKLTNNNISKF